MQEYKIFKEFIDGTWIRFY